MAMDSIPTGAAPRIAVVTTDESVQLAAQEVLASAFHTTLLGSGEQILPLLDEVSLEAIILDLETAHVSDQDVLRLVRGLRDRDENLVLLGFTRSHNKASRSQFEQAGISRCFVAPVDFEEVQSVLRRALEERSTEIENRRLREEARERNSFCQLIGGSGHVGDMKAAALVTLTAHLLLERDVLFERSLVEQLALLFQVRGELFHVIFGESDVGFAKDQVGR